MPRTDKKERCSAATSLSTAVAVFFMVSFALFFLIVRPLVTEAGGRISINAGASSIGLALDIILVTVLFGLPLYVACVVSITTYYTLRWKVVPRDDRYCIECGYDLTGNVVGRCPECGATIEQEVDAT